MAYHLAALAIVALPLIIKEAARVLAIAKAKERNLAAVAAAAFGQQSHGTPPLDGKEEGSSHESRTDELDQLGLAQIKNIRKFRRMRRGRADPK